MERLTRQRQAIWQVIADAGRPLSPQEVLALAHVQMPNLGIATVYRNLKALMQSGEVRSVELPGISPRFEVLSQGHHHHFQCTSCERVFDVPACPGNLADLAPKGFVVEAHSITLYGRCNDC
ncbi:MAG: transcriptional repressor [Limnobacter sp.]|nr:transcriptional repressor [Limnobacter sp.]